MQLYDGGLVANVPMRQALAMGARSLVVLDCNFPGHVPGPPATIAEVPVIYLHGPEPHPVSPLDFRQTNLLIETSYEAARAFLADLEVTGPGLYGSP